jgi:isopentenyl phosphate kinase
MNPLTELIDLYYNKTECAKAIGITPQRLNGWIDRGFIPFMHGDMVQKSTKGKIKASSIREYAGNLKKGIK